MIMFKHWKKELENKVGIFKVSIRKIKRKTKNYLMMIQRRMKCQINLMIKKK